MIQEIIVAIIVVAAIVAVIVRAAKRKKCGGSICGSCSKDCPLRQIKTRKNNDSAARK